MFPVKTNQDTWETHRRHHHDVYHHVSLGAAAQISVWITRQFIFTPALCEWPTAEKWQTAAAALMQRLCVRGAILSLHGYYHFLFGTTRWRKLFMSTTTNSGTATNPNHSRRLRTALVQSCLLGGCWLATVFSDFSNMYSYLSGQAEQLEDSRGITKAYTPRCRMSNHFFCIIFPRS